MAQGQVAAATVAVAAISDGGLAHGSLGEGGLAVERQQLEQQLGDRKKRAIDRLLPTYLEDGRRADARPAWQQRPDELLEQAETRQLVRDKIDQLPDEHRIVLILRDIEQVSTADTAQLLQLSNTTVKTRLHRARQALRTLLEAKLV